MKKELSIEQMATVLFMLCSDVQLLKTRDGCFYYFRPRVLSNIQAIQYVLRQNGVMANRHRSHYYNAEFGNTDLIVRVPKLKFDSYANPKFKQAFEKMYSNRTEFMLGLPMRLDNVGNMFWAKTKSGKIKVLTNIVERHR